MKVCIWLFLGPSLWLPPPYLYCPQSHFSLTLSIPGISLSIFTEPIFSWPCSLWTPSGGFFLISWLLWVLQTKHTKLTIQSRIHIWKRRFEICLFGPALPHSVWFFSFFHLSASLINSFLFRAEHNSIVTSPHFYYPFFSWWAARLFLFPGYCD